MNDYLQAALKRIPVGNAIPIFAARHPDASPETFWIIKDAPKRYAALAHQPTPTVELRAGTIPIEHTPALVFIVLARISALQISCEAFIDAHGHGAGLDLIQGLARQEEICFSFYDEQDQHQHTITVANTVKSPAMAMLQQAKDTQWSKGEFDIARTVIIARYSMLQVWEQLSNPGS